MIGDFFEKSHKKFKDHCRKSSENLTPMSDTVKLQEEYLWSEAMAAGEQN